MINLVSRRDFMIEKLGLLAANIRYPRRLMNLLKIQRNHDKFPERVSYLPYVVDIEPNIKCNLACRMCQITTWDRSAPDMSLVDFKSLIEKIPTLLKIKLQGMGEPFLNRELMEMIEYAVGRKIKMVTNTNGTLLGEKLSCRIIKSGLDTIAISIDGATAETYEKIRIKGDFNKVIKNLELLVSLRGGRPYPKINVWMVGLKENIHELPDLVKICAKIGVDELILQHDVNYWGKEEWEDRLSGISLSEDREKADGFIREAEGIARGTGTQFRVFEGDRYSVENNNPCRWPWESFYITTDGYICPCCIACDPGVINFGNIREQSIVNIWNSEEYMEFRRRIKSGDIPSFCRGCYEDAHMND